MFNFKFFGGTVVKFLCWESLLRLHQMPHSEAVGFAHDCAVVTCSGLRLHCVVVVVSKWWHLMLLQGPLLGSTKWSTGLLAYMLKCIWVQTPDWSHSGTAQSLSLCQFCLSLHKCCLVIWHIFSQAYQHRCSDSYSFAFTRWCHIWCDHL